MSFKQLSFKQRLYLLAAAGLILISLALPWWTVIMSAPTYPEKNLMIRVYPDKYTGDIKEWNTVGKLVGVQVPPPFPPQAFTVIPAVVAGIAVLSALAAYQSRLRRAAMTAPWAFMLGMAVWLQYILYNYGHNLDPERPLRYIKPFTPPVVGIVTVGKIRTFHVPDVGAGLFFAAAVLVLLALWNRKQGVKSDVANQSRADG